MKNHSAAEAEVAKAHAKAIIEFGQQYEYNHPPQVDGWFSFAGTGPSEMSGSLKRAGIPANEKIFLCVL
jgi:hypothetical protein